MSVSEGKNCAGVEHDAGDIAIDNERNFSGSRHETTISKFGIGKPTTNQPELTTEDVIILHPSAIFNIEDQKSLRTE